MKWKYVLESEEADPLPTTKQEIKSSFYAIRHKPSGYFLPQRNSLRGGGHTHSEPTGWDPPRLFVEKSSAKKALAWWLQGVFSSDYDGYVSSKFQESRKAEDMEIVELIIKEKQSGEA